MSTDLFASVRRRAAGKSRGPALVTMPPSEYDHRPVQPVTPATARRVGVLAAAHVPDDPPGLLRALARLGVLEALAPDKPPPRL